MSIQSIVKRLISEKTNNIVFPQFTIQIEKPSGTLRSGYDATGRYWENYTRWAYGCISGTTGIDGDEVDVLVGYGAYEENPLTFVVTQLKNGEIDEHKLMFGFPNQTIARSAYMDFYNANCKNMYGGISEGMDVNTLYQWLINNGFVNNIQTAIAETNLSTFVHPDGVDEDTERRYDDHASIYEAIKDYFMKYKKSTFTAEIFKGERIIKSLDIIDVFSNDEFYALTAVQKYANSKGLSKNDITGMYENDIFQLLKLIHNYKTNSSVNDWNELCGDISDVVYDMMVKVHGDYVTMVFSEY